MWTVQTQYLMMATKSRCSSSLVSSWCTLQHCLKHCTCRVGIVSQRHCAWRHTFGSSSGCGAAHRGRGVQGDGAGLHALLLLLGMVVMVLLLRDGGGGFRGSFLALQVFYICVQMRVHLCRPGMSENAVVCCSAGRHT